MRRLMLAAVLVLVSATGVFAEVRFYFVPKIGDGLTRQTSFRPKYTDPGSLGVGLDLTTWESLDYGVEAVMVLAADVTAEQHAALSAQTDVLAVPAQLDNTVSAVALPTVQAKLEAMKLPAEWVTTAMTYRTVLRAVIKIIELAQRYNGLHGSVPLFDSGITLNTRWNELTADQRQRLRAVGDSFGIDYSGVTNVMTLRQILRLLGDQLPGFTLRGEAF